ncbi:hypothetical protein CPB85DRAFT_1293093 [Mucidula mucida]|nr:hypothetical protein CPB85DRAFT_1293093 [Mucidula mucida]
MPHKFDQLGAASTKAIKKEVQAKGLGVPQSTGHAHGDELFREAPSAPNSPGINMEDVKNPHSAGTDSKVGAAGATGTIEV